MRCGIKSSDVDANTGETKYPVELVAEVTQVVGKICQRRETCGPSSGMALFNESAICFAAMRKYFMEEDLPYLFLLQSIGLLSTILTVRSARHDDEVGNISGFKIMGSFLANADALRAVCKASQQSPCYKVLRQAENSMYCTLFDIAKVNVRLQRELLDAHFVPKIVNALASAVMHPEEDAWPSTKDKAHPAVAVSRMLTLIAVDDKLLEPLESDLGAYAFSRSVFGTYTFALQHGAKSCCRM